MTSAPTGKTIVFSELCGFTPKQWEATEAADSHRYTLFGGARGPGKSYWLRWYCVRFLLRAAGRGLRNVRVMLACEDYPSLYERQISKIEIEFPAWLGKYHISRNEYRLAPVFGGGVIALRNLDDAAKYMSAEFAMMAVDEVAKNPEKVFHILRGSLRWPGLRETKFVAASNPAANWVRLFWLEHNLPKELKGQEDAFVFIPALPDDNPNLSEDYWRELDSIPGSLGRAWRHGDWYAAAEGLVYEAFGEGNIVATEPDLSRPFELAVDDGYIDPRAILFIQELPNGDVLIFDELYQTKRLEEQSIRDVMAKCAGYAKRDLPDHWNTMDLTQCLVWCKQNEVPLPRLAVASHEAVALRDRLTAAGIKAVNWLSRQNPEKGSTRMAAIRLTRSLICDGQGHRSIHIHRRCRSLMDEISMGYRYPEGKNGLEEEPEDGNDHACQAMETWVWWHHGGQRKKAQVR
jgi:hypothetical protein